jgi:predicted phosphodiesterase
MKSHFEPVRRMKAAAAAAAMLMLCTAALGAQGYAASGLNISPGADGRELNFAWMSASPAKPVVQIALRAAQSGDAFPAAKATAFTGTAEKASATQFNTDDKTVATGSYADKVTVKGLADSTDYVYRVGDGKAWSDPFTVSTRSQASFGFLAMGDPQLGSRATGPKTLEADTQGWQDTVRKATSAFPGSSFLICLGDEVNDYSSLASQDAEYQAYFSPVQMLSLPVATVVGNHDFAMGEYYGFHYNQPNLSARYGISYGNDGDYWFVYGNTLFMMLNSNTEGVATHDLFIRDTVARNAGAKWRVVCFHHSLYSEADHFADPDILDRRSTYAPVFERYKIDVVLMGHDHAYTRTLPLSKGKPAAGIDPKADTVSDPAGIVYFTLDSGSGSKFYDWTNAAPEAFSAARWQGKVPSFSYVSVDGGKLTVATFRADDMSLIDEYSIRKAN